MLRTLPALVAILAIPLARLSAAPLALAWNRHRGALSGGNATAESTTIFRRRGKAVGAVLLLIGLPPVLVLAGEVSFQVWNRNNGSIVSSGEKREYLLYVPESYDSSKPTPLVIGMHGGAMLPTQQMHLTHWNDLADENGFIVVYPAGTGSVKKWHTFDLGPGLERDVRFFSELIDTLESAYNIDPARIYAHGVRSVVHPVGPDRGRRHGGAGAVASAQLVCQHATGADGRVPRGR